MKKIVFVLTTALIIGMGTMSAQNKFKAAQSKTGTTTTKTKTEAKAPATKVQTTTKTEAKAPATKVQATKTEAKAPATKVQATKTEAKAPATKAQTTNKFETKARSTKVEAKTAAPKTAERKPALKAQPIGKVKAAVATEGKTATKAAAKPAAKKVAAAKPVDVGTFNGTWANSYSDGIGGMVTDYLELTVDTTTGIAKGMYKDENGDGRAVSGKLQGNRLVMTYDADGDEFATINIINANTLKLEGFTGTFKRVEDMNSAPKVDITTPVDQAPVDPAYQEVKKYLQGDN